MSTQSQVTSGRTSPLREEIISAMESYYDEVVAQCKEDEEYEMFCDDVETDYLFALDIATYTLTNYSENTLLALKESGMSPSMIVAVIDESDDGETLVREIAHYYGSSNGCSDRSVVDTVRSIYGVADLSAFDKGTDAYDDVSRVLAAAVSLRASRIRKETDKLEEEEPDEWNDGSFLFTSAMDDDCYFALMTPQLAEVICRFPNDFDRISRYFDERELLPESVDTGHLIEFLKAPSVALGVGVL